MMNYLIAEEFVSINGEGRWAGALAHFLRFPSCNLNCSYCDTRWVNEKDFTASEMTLEQILDLVRSSGLRHVTVTGGEPLLQKGILPLLQALSALPLLQVEVETNGSIALAPLLRALPAVSFTMDYKLPSSGMEARMHLDNLKHLRAHDALKLVCGSREDLLRGKALVEAYGLAGRLPIFLSPVFGVLDPQEMVEFMKKEGLSMLRLQLQLHKFIWSPTQRGV